MWVEVTPDDGPEDLRRKASMVRQSPRQVSWQRQELTAFVHFGPNTFTGLEWGTGLDDPAVFDPSGLDFGQWAGALADAEFKSVILTAKHHDGFCLWPSRYLEHTVASSSFQGDVVAELATAAEAHGLAMGFYLSTPRICTRRRPPAGTTATAAPRSSRSFPLWWRVMIGLRWSRRGSCRSLRTSLTTTTGST